MCTLKNLVFSIMLFLIIGTAISQDINSDKKNSQKEEVEYPNIIKINSLALVFNNASLLYERAIIPRLSVGMGVGYKYAGAEPKLLAASNSDIAVDIDKITGISITPEARYYIKACDPGKLEGFYAGVYLRYTGYRSGASFEYFQENQPTESYHSDLSLNEYGVGIQLGYQLVIKERFTIDFMFLGPRFSSYHLGYNFDKQPSQEFLDELSEYLNEVVDRFGLDYKIDIKNEGDAKATTAFSFANTRFGISFGFAF